VRQAIDRLTGDARPWVLAGDSAGANLALADSQSRRDRGVGAARGLILFYGSYLPYRRSDSIQRWGSGEYGLSEAALLRYALAYCPPESEPLVGSALRAAIYPAEGRLEDLPPCFLMAAACDPLRDDSTQLEHGLRSVGNALEAWVVPGVIHGFMNYGRVLPEVDQVLTRLASWLANRDGIERN